MKLDRLLLAGLLLLSACRTSPTAPAASGSAPGEADNALLGASSAQAACPENCVAGQRHAGDVDVLLAYQHTVRQMSASALSRTLANLNRQPASARLLMQKAMLLAGMHTNGDLLRAQGLLEQVLASNAADAERLKPLAGLLYADYGEWRRLDDNLERLTQQLHDEQRRAEQANDKLDALKNIERTLQAQPKLQPPPPAGAVGATDN